MSDTTNHEVSERLEGKWIANIVCFILGLGSLMAFSTIITIDDYYYQVFPDYHPSRVLTLVYQPFSIVSIIIFTFYEDKINIKTRNLIGYAIFPVTNFLLIVLDLCTSGKGGVGSYVVVCAIVASFGFADALIEGGMVGDLSQLCPEFIQSFMAGLVASGALTSVLRLITRAVFDNYKNGLRKGAMLFLALSTFIETVCLVLYAFVFPKLPLVKFYRARVAAQGSTTMSAHVAGTSIETPTEDKETTERLSTKELFVQNIDYALDVFLAHVLTFSIFPGFLYESTGHHGLGSWYALVLVSMDYGWDLVGRYIPLIKCLKLESRKGIMIAVLARFLLVPAFYFTAKYGAQGYMIFLTSFLGLSNGYLTVCVLTLAPKGYKATEQIALGNLLIVWLLGGISVGVALDFLWLIGKPGAF